MKQFFRIITLIIGTSASAQEVIDTELSADLHSYGYTVFSNFECLVEQVRSAPGEETFYIQDRRVAIVIENDSLAGYIETYSDGLLTGEYWFPPSDKSQMWKELDRVFETNGLPPFTLIKLGAASCP